MAAAPVGRHDRGRDAEAPWRLPRAAWRDVFWRSYHELARDRISLTSAAIAFYSMLSLFPALSVGLALLALLLDPHELPEKLSAIEGILPVAGFDVVTSQLQGLAAESGGTLGIGAVVSLLIAAWSARKAASALIRGCNLVYGEVEDRGFVRLTLLAIVLTGFALVAWTLGIGLLLVAPLINAGAERRLGIVIPLVWLRWPLLAVLCTAGLAFVYRVAPNRRRPRWRWVSLGSVFATLVWIGGSAAFSWYATALGRYNEIYGAVSGFIVLLLWLHLSAFSVLLGGKLNAEIEHQTSHDSTVGAVRPMGERGARVADQLGPERSRRKHKGKRRGRR